MRLARRHFLQCTAGTVAASNPLICRMAQAQSYPSRPVRIIVGFPAGNAPDVTARLIGQKLSDRMGQQFFIENRTGAGTNIATEAVVRAPTDGYTLLLASSSNTVNTALYSDLHFDFVRDIAPIAMIGVLPFVMVVTPTIPARTIPEFIAYAKANPGKISMASPGIGTTTHLFGELFKMLTDIDWVHVPYRNSFFPDLLSGQVQVSFTTITASLPFIREEKLKALGLTSPRPSAILPDVSPIGAFIPGYEGVGWNGLAAPKNTSAEIITALNAGVNAVISNSGIRSQLISLGAEPMPMTPADFAKFIGEDAEKWAKLIRAANIKPA